MPRPGNSEKLGQLRQRHPATDEPDSTPDWIASRACASVRPSRKMLRISALQRRDGRLSRNRARCRPSTLTPYGWAGLPRQKHEREERP